MPRATGYDAAVEVAPRIRCPILVGRGSETAALTDALEAARRGRGAAMVVLGEAGSGKTRMLRDLVAASRTREIIALIGAASPLGGPPYALLAQAFRSSLRWRALPVADMEPFSRGLRMILPEWPAAPTASDLDQAQLQLLAMESAVQLLARLAAGRGCLLALEDVHWADVGSLQVLEYLAASIDDIPALVVMTLRTGEDAPKEAAMKALAGRRQGVVLQLGRLDAAGVREMAEAILGRPQPNELIQQLASRSLGNPLLVEELLESELAEGEEKSESPSAPVGAALRVPRTMRKLVADKLARLSGPAREVVCATAISRDFDVRLLSAMVSQTEQQVAEALREGVQIGLLEVVDGEMGFRHVLVVDAIIDELLPTEREGLNEKAARALAARHGDDPAYAERRGIHLIGAGRPADAWEHLLVAGRWKFAAGLGSAADLTMRAALAAAPTPRARDRCRAALAITLSSTGRWEEALDVERAAESDDDRASRLARMARAAAFCGRLIEADELRAKAAAAGADEAAMLALGALTALWRGKLHEAREDARKAADLAESLGSREIQCEALDVLGRAADALGARDEAGRAFDRWADTAARTGLAMGQVQARMERGNLDFMSGGPDAGLRSARELAISAGAYVSHALADLSLVWWLGHRGRLQEACDLADEAIELTSRFRLDIAHHAAVAAGWARSKVDPGAAETFLSQALALAPGDADVEILVAWTRGDAALRLGDWEKAADEYRAGSMIMNANPSAVPPPPPFMLPCALAAAGRMAEAKAAIEEARASPALRRLYVNPQWLAVAAAFVDGSADRLVAATDTMRANSANNRALALELGSIVFGAAHAREWLTEALASFEAAGAEVDAARCRRLMRQASIPVPRARMKSSRRSGRGAPLSPREAEVLDMVGRGFTNHEIAARLFLSKRTVESHVAALLRKLDMPGRPALIAFAARELQI